METFITNKRFDKFKEIVESSDFEKIFYRILLEHRGDYIQSLYDSGSEIDINNKLKFIYEFLNERIKIYKENDEFKSWKFKKFLFVKFKNNIEFKYIIENISDKKIILKI